MTSQYQLQFGYVIASKNAYPTHFTRFFLDGMTITGVPLNMRYKEKAEHVDSVVTFRWKAVDASGTVSVGNGAKQLTFEKDVTCYTTDYDTSDEENGWI